MVRFKLGSIGPTVGTVSHETVAAMPKRADPFYLSREWRDLLDYVIKTRGRRCERCGTGRGRIYGDHIRAIEDGGDRLDPSNIQLLCASCHTLKTNQDKRRRMR